MALWVFSIHTFPSYGQSPKTSLPKDLLSIKVTLIGQPITINDALHELSKNKQIKFTFINNDIPLSAKIFIHSTKVPLYIVLDSIFEGTDILYYQVANQIVLKKKGYEVPSVKSGKINPHTKPSTPNSQDQVEPKDSIPFAIDSFLIQGNSSADSTTKEITTNKMESKTDSISTLSKPNPLVNSNHQSRFSIGVFGMPCTSFRNSYPSSDVLVIRRNADESSVFTFSGGIKMDYMIFSKFYIQSGLTYFNVGEQGTHTAITIIQSPPNQGPPGQRPLPAQTITSKFSYQNSYTYLSIPISLGYTIGEKFFLSASIGLQTNIFLFNTTNYPQYDEIHKEEYYESPKSHSFQPVTFSFVSSIDLGYRFENGISVTISPTYGTFLSSIYTPTDAIQEFPYIFGGSAGISYRFKSKKQ